MDSVLDHINQLQPLLHSIPSLHHSSHPIHSNSLLLSSSTTPSQTTHARLLPPHSNQELIKSSYPDLIDHQDPFPSFPLPAATIISPKHPPTLTLLDPSDPPSAVSVSPFPSQTFTSSSTSAPSSGSTPRSSTSCSNRIPKPPPISISPSLRRLSIQPTQSLSSLLNPDSLSNPAGQQLELAERSHWDIRTGRADALAMRLKPSDSSSNPVLPPSRDGGRDRWGNRWGIENHILSPAISERTEPTHTSISSPVSSTLLLPASPMDPNSTQDVINPYLAPPSSPNSPSASSAQLENSHSIQPQNRHHHHALHLLNRKKIKTQITNRQRDLDIAHRQIAKRIEKQRRDLMINRRDEIAAQLMRNPTDAKLVRDLGKLYLEFHHPALDDKPLDSWRRDKSSQATSRSEPSLKLAIHYLEQSIQLDNFDPLTWSYLAKAWSLLLAYPTENNQEREQRLSNSSLAFRKAIVISSNQSNPNNLNIQHTNRFRLSYAQHLEGIQKYKEAASILQDALELDEIDADCWWALGRMMELWALDTQSEIVITKRERFERMKHSCEAYQKAIELQPEDSFIRQSQLKAAVNLEKLKAELKEEEEAKVRTLKTAEDVALTAEKMRGLNLSPVNNKIPLSTPKKTNSDTAKSSSTLALKKLVAEMREIPEFGKKSVFSSPANPSASPTSNQKEKQLTTEPVLSINCTVTRVESVASSSPTPSPHTVHPIQASHSETDESSYSHFSPSSQKTRQNPDIARELESFQLSPPAPGPPLPKNPARYSKDVSPISITPSTQNSSAISSQSQNDVKMTIISLSTASIESQNHESSKPQQSPRLQRKNKSNRAFASNSYSPPSPSALPTSMMHSLSSRSCSSKGTMSLSPRNILNSMPTSGGYAQKEGEAVTCQRSPPASRRSSISQPPIVDHVHVRSPTSISSQINENNAERPRDHSHVCKSNAQPSPRKDGPEECSMVDEGTLYNSTNRITDELNFMAPHSPRSRSQQSNDYAEIPCHQHQTILANVTRNHDRNLHAQERNVVSPKSNSPCTRNLGGYLGHHPQDQVALDLHQHSFQTYAGKPVHASAGTVEFNSPLSQVEQDPLRAIGNSELELMRSPPPPQIPPRPKSLGIHQTVPMNLNTIPSLNSPVVDENFKSESNLGINPHLHGCATPFNPFQGISQRYQSPTLEQNANAFHDLEETEPPGSSFPPRSPISDSRKRRTISLIPHIGKSINERLPTTLNSNQLDYLSPSSSHHPLDNHPQHSCPVYDYSLIDSHLQSILEVDMKRKAELKEIKKQIRKTDEWAENQRRSIVEEIRRICTPVNNSSTASKKPIQDNQNDDDDGRSSVSKNRQRSKFEYIRPMIKQNSIKADHPHRKNQSESHHHGENPKSRNACHQNFMIGRVNRSEMSTSTNSHTRSMSTPPELNHQHYHRPSSTHFPNLQHKQHSQPTQNEFSKDTVLPNMENFQRPYVYQPLVHPLPTGLKPDSNKPGRILSPHADEFDKLGPAGFAINGITSIIQLLHQPRRQQFP